MKAKNEANRTHYFEVDFWGSFIYYQWFADVQ